MSAYDNINTRYKTLTGRTLEQSAKIHKQRTQDIERQLADYNAELERRRKENAAFRERMKSEDVGMMGGAPTNNVGAGEIAGLGVGPQGEPGINKKKKKSPITFSMFRRKRPQI